MVMRPLERAPERDMPPTVESVEADALQLTTEERADLIDRLLASLKVDPEIEAAWDREVEARMAAYDRGESKTYPAEDVFAEARRLIS